MMQSQETRDYMQVATPIQAQPATPVVALENAMKQLNGCRCDGDIQALSLSVEKIMLELSGVSHESGDVLKAMKASEIALKNAGQTVKSSRISKMRKLFAKLPKQSPKKQRKMLREILALAKKNLGMKVAKRGFCGASLSCNAAVVTGSVLVLAGATAVISMAAMGHFEAPEDVVEDDMTNVGDATEEPAQHDEVAAKPSDTVTTWSTNTSHMEQHTSPEVELALYFPGRLEEYRQLCRMVRNLESSDLRIVTDPEAPNETRYGLSPIPGTFLDAVMASNPDVELPVVTEDHIEYELNAIETHIGRTSRSAIYHGTQGAEFWTEHIDARLNDLERLEHFLVDAGNARDHAFNRGIVDAEKISELCNKIGEYRAENYFNTEEYELLLNDLEEQQVNDSLSRNIKKWTGHVTLNEDETTELMENNRLKKLVRRANFAKIQEMKLGIHGDLRSEASGFDLEDAQRNVIKLDRKIRNTLQAYLDNRNEHINRFTNALNGEFVNGQ